MHKPMDVTATPNLISFRMWCRSAIDHRRHSIDTGQCAIGTGGQFGGGGNTAGPPLVAASRPLQFLDPDQE